MFNHIVLAARQLTTSIKQLFCGFSKTTPAASTTPIETKMDSPKSVEVDDHASDTTISSSSSNVSTLPILIIGAGFGGLNVAQGLRKAGVPFLIFERDSNSTFRIQGYRIRIDHLGSYGLRTCLSPELWERFEKSCAITEMGMTLFDALTGETKERIEGMENLPIRYEEKPYSADRHVTRDILMSGVEENIMWNKQFMRYEMLPDDKGVRAYFADGSFADGSLLVGADGVKSRVRKQYLPENHVPRDAHARGIYGRTPITPELLSKIPPDVMRWITLMRDSTIEEKPIEMFIEPTRFQDNEYRDKLPEDYVYWVLGSHMDNFNLDGDKNPKDLFGLSPAEAAALSRRLTTHWHPSARLLVDLQREEFTSIVRITTVAPPIAPWKASRVTLVGDAIHSMPPTAGQGANTALKDGGVLFECLKEKGVNVEAVEAYETKMRKYASEVVEGSYIRSVMMLGLDDLEDCTPLEY